LKKKQKEIEEIVNPIIQKLGGGMGGGSGMNFNPEDFQNFQKNQQTGGEDEKKDDDDKKDEDSKPKFEDLDVD